MLQSCNKAVLTGSYWVLQGRIQGDQEGHGPLKMLKSKRCKFMPKMHQNMFGGLASPGPAGGGGI